MRSKWIIGRRADLALILGSPLAGYLYLILNVAFQLPFSWLWWVWSVGFDGTHIFAMATRTYLDAGERRKRGTLLWGSLLVFFSVGPLMVLAGLKALLWIVVGVWAYYHVMRQHYGFLMLYKLKNADLQSKTQDGWFLMLMLTAPPFLRFFIRSPQELGIPERFALGRMIPGFEILFWTGLAALTASYLVNLLREDSFNAPKLMLLGGVIPLHWLTFHYMSWQASVPTVTIVHNLQYHALVWLHNQNKYAAGTRLGTVPAAVTRSLMLYLAAGLAFSLLYRVPGYYLGQVSDLAFGLFCGFGLTHYYLDSRIWRLRSDPELAETLQLRAA
ncbi:MAG: hypothetical protein HYZ37_06445 [Candidatus Solibacter usitatus]|nr:hypothetical protein [Candidatus Solibacter usitatus]